MTIKKMKPAAVIFDLDGTLIDNNAYHIEAWKVFHDKINRPFSAEEYKTVFNGKINRDIFNYIFQKELPDADIDRYTEEKESLYRQLYAPHIQMIPGLTQLLDALMQAAIPMAIATSGLPANIEFMFDHLPIRKYFEVIVDATQIKKGKPDPEIFLTAAALMHANPAFCIAFEDSVAGVMSAKNAGMKVVALTTTHAQDDFNDPDLVIKDYSNLSIERLLEMINK
ncbi:MAG: HAD family phosphatase [Chitinophagaceae bacterium]|nr:HAD family phosphatase [Chitinophagaceae bacterium]